MEKKVHNNREPHGYDETGFTFGFFRIYNAPQVLNQTTNETITHTVDELMTFQAVVKRDTRNSEEI